MALYPAPLYRLRLALLAFIAFNVIVIATFSFHRRKQWMAFQLPTSLPRSQRTTTDTANINGHLDVQLPNLRDPKLLSMLRKYEAQFKRTSFKPLKHNRNGVRYVGSIGNRAGGDELVCKLKRRHKFAILDQNTSPFMEMGLAEYFPADSGFESLENRFKSCAVIASSSFMNGSGLGSEIDSHDAVLRFNMAPTEGHEKDVGTKTTVRLVNSQVLEKNVEEFEQMAANVNQMFFLWRTGPYNGNLYQWYSDKSTQKFFIDYIQWCYRHPRLKPRMINPISLWKAWDVIQEHADKDITKTVPTSGFTGILIMLRLCEKVDVYGYITANHSACHYYTMKRSCAPLSWHPVGYEKDVVKRMSEGALQDPAQWQGTSHTTWVLHRQLLTVVVPFRNPIIP
ncbi:beta-galactoside alpha-2,6-sialyltransferase 2-like [Ptychodera flava]|uniref:beta-galactoside alpha-2,6-sialyltransferase 2-like n=1 Tax=Ptychodera flava TaxID=63121 RepID=UPI00396AA87E